MQAVCLFLQQGPVVEPGPAGGAAAGVDVVQDFMAGGKKIGASGVSALHFERQGVR